MKGSLHAWDTSSSPFSSVLGTNHVPSPTELDQLKDLLVEPQHELKRLQSEISRLQLLLDTLLEEKSEVETYIEAHRILMSPIRRIPSETLGEIFIHCLPSDSYPFCRSRSEASSSAYDHHMSTLEVCCHRYSHVMELFAYTSSPSLERRDGFSTDRWCEFVAGTLRYPSNLYIISWI
ncbi:hypothetical protein BDP27DRAFT_1432534 [Rhodocollybia butyracea]|uniref:Uncharacterized protein n=1 Tax=Rhodocollybia butyracea TaxID=206335 RepID=A0A9P5P7W3_9AGAR|nr:hypothetical protein BDP27DRAFT_1432534 [Rhodocollybia butyracea]